MNRLFFSVHDIRDKDDIFVLSRSRIHIKKDFMARCASLPLELKYEILVRCPLGTVKFLRRNKKFWDRKRQYDEQQYARAKIYWRPGPKRIMWDPEDGEFDLHRCKRPRSENMPLEFEISHFWGEIQLCHASRGSSVVTPYRSNIWKVLIREIERLTHEKHLLEIQLQGTSESEDEDTE